MTRPSSHIRTGPSHQRFTLRAWFAVLPLVLLLLNCGESGRLLAPEETPDLQSSVSSDAAPAASPGVPARDGVADGAPTLATPAPFADPEANPFQAGLLPPLPIVGDLIDWLSIDTDGLLQFLLPPLSLKRSTGKLVRASEGGFVELNGFRVDIPAGALSSDTYITIKLPKTLPEALFVMADFGPSGTTFQLPVQVTMPLGGVSLLGIDLDALHVSYWDGSEWVSQGGEVSGSFLRASTTHFTVYGARDGVDTPSGG